MGTTPETRSITPALSRRTFVQVSGALVSTVAASRVFRPTAAWAGMPEKSGLRTGEFLPDELETADDIMYSVCQMCHSRCGVRAKVKEGILVKLDGNPYHPNNRDVDEGGRAHRVPYDTPPDEAFTELGRMCLKGQSGVQTLYDPFRIQHPLKRVGPRNSGRWQTISWEQAFTEIAAAIRQLIPDPDALIDPSKPELGRKRNLLGFSPGRSTEKELSDRIWKNGWGTVNADLGHTSVCESSRHVTNEVITWDPAGTKNSMGGGRSSGWQVDILGAEYIIFFGANPLEADFPMVGMARNLMQFKRNGGRYVTVDPRFNNTGAQASQWVPITPGTDAALAMGMMSWIFERNAYDATYLRNANQAAAVADGEPTWTDSTYLVGTFVDSTGGQFQRYITAGEAGIPGAPATDYVVRSGGRLRGHSQAGHGDLEVSTTVRIGTAMVQVKSAFTLLKTSALSRTRSQYSSICGVPVSVMEDLAMELTSHGKKAAVITYRGPVKHTNGFYNQLAIQHLNTLIGNYDWKGGCTVGAGGWGNGSGVVSLGRVAGDPAASGVSIDRVKKFYTPAEVPNLFTGYPARRPWFPFGTHGNYQEVIPSTADGYPYRLKVLITYWNAWPYSVPALRRVWEQTAADQTKLPLLVAISPVMGEVAAWADYVLPDSVYLEKFSVPGIPWRVNKGTSFQRPVVGSFDGRAIGVSPSAGGVGNTIPINDTNDYTPALPDTRSVVDIHLGLAFALGLPGVGANALLDASGSPVGDLYNSWDWARAMLANIAHNAQGAHPGVSREEILARGGVFDYQGDEYDGELLAYRYGNIIKTFADPVARTRDSVTGQYYSGVAQYKAVAHSDGGPINDGTNYPFRLITYKSVHHGQGRTNVNPWLMLMIPENPVEISADDASRLGIVTGDRVTVSSVSNPTGITGRALVTQRLKPGVIAISHHYGHWEQSSRPMVVNGASTGFDASRAAGIQPTQIMRTDRRYSNVSLQEPLGASCSFYDTLVRVVKVA